LLALFVLLCPGQLRAQLVTGDVLGTVTDSTGAVVPGAKVTLLNTGTGIASSTTTNGTGEFLFSNVQIGAFKVAVEAKGFKSFNVANVTLAAGQRLRVNAQLQVGSQVESVQVEAAAAVQLESDSSDIKSEIATSSMTEMPTNGRNYYNLIGLQPGAQSGGGSGDPTDNRPSMDFQANGQSSYFNNNMIDGMDNNMVSLGTVAVEPSLDALEEVQVETSNYSAEYSRTGGGIANLITKSGTNHLHGSAFEFIRNDDFDAYPWTNGTPTKTKLRQNQFGGSLGGPILKNKAFFFGDYQGWRQVQGSISKKMVPIQADYDVIHTLGGDTASVKNTPSTLTFQDPFDGVGGMSGNGVTISAAGTTFQNGVVGTVANKMNPYGLAQLMAMPAPNQSASTCASWSAAEQLCTAGNYNWSGPLNTIQNANTLDGRIDYHFNDRNTLFGRFSYNKTDTDGSGAQLPLAMIVEGNSHLWAGHYSINPVLDTNVALDYVHIFNPTTIFEAKASYSRAADNSHTLGTEYWSLSKLGIPNPSGYDSSTLPGLPAIGLDDAAPHGAAYSPYTWSGGMDSTGTGYAVGVMDGAPDYFIQNTFQYNGSLTMNRKSHSIKMGLTLLRRQINSSNAGNGGPNFSAVYTGNYLTDILEGLSDQVSENTPMAVFYGRFWEPSAYIQDDWRATKSLTINLGIRYDLYTPETSRNGNISNFDLNSDLVVSPSLLGPNKSGSTAGVMTDYHDISPRLGFAYSLPFADNIVLKNMVLRGGFGISYFPGDAGTMPGSHEYQLLNSPFLWGMACGNKNFYPTLQCGPTNGYLTSSALGTGDQYDNNPYGIDQGDWAATHSSAAYPFSTATNATAAAANPKFTGDWGYGGFNIEDGFPASQYVSSLATDPSTYVSGFGANLFMMPNFKPSYLYQFNLQVQKQLGNNIMTAGFVGNLGRRMPSFQNINTPTNGIDGTTPAGFSDGDFPMWSAAHYWMGDVPVGESISEGNSTWEAGEATYERRMTKGLTASVNYTWARTEAQSTATSYCAVGCIVDNGNGSGSPESGWQQYGWSGSTSHRVAGMATYQVPFGSSLHGPLGAAVKGWELNGVGNWNTGGWTTITDTANETGLEHLPTVNRAGGTEYPSVVKGVSVKPANQSYSNYINAAAFQLQPLGTLGNATNPSVQGPRSRDLDMGLDKTFSLLEGFKLQFRAEAFNVSNTPNYSLAGGGGPGGPPPPGGGAGGSPTSISAFDSNGIGTNANSFGVISSVSSQPRIFQFALRLIY
jgi:hypothetical protein